MSEKEKLLEKSIVVLVEKAEDCIALAKTQHQIADKQHEIADKQHEIADNQDNFADKPHEAAEEQREAADEQHEAADQQHEAAVRLDTLGTAMISDAAGVKGEMEVDSGRTSPPLRERPDLQKIQKKFFGKTA